MPAAAASPVAHQIFRVHLDHDTPEHQVEADSFIDAAFAGLERWSPGHDAESVRVFVRHPETGERHCFTLHPQTGEADSCD